MKNAYCLECERRINLQGKLRVGDMLACPHCEAEFMITAIEPLVIDWPYEDEDRWEEYLNKDYDDTEDVEPDEDDDADWEEEWRHLINRQRKQEERRSAYQRRRLLDSTYDD